ncbi:MAG: cellulase family glycosylhydrolase, partial [Deltaproteobacteria bacterium]|nr:cellulase family glycosylhydrolase [Deltaproteobacteria bacterium]
MKIPLIFSVSLAVILAACGNASPPPVQPLPITRATTDRNYLRDGYGRYVFLHGVNLSGSTKVPMAIDGQPVTLNDMDEPFTKGVPSYVGHPFPGHADHVVSLEEIAGAADEGFRRIRDAGFNSVRLLVNWEGVEPTKKGAYDLDYLKSIRTVVQAADKYGIYVLMDMHQDAFSRHLMVRYNEEPEYEDPQLGTVAPEPGSIENMLLALAPPYTDAVRGEGAPRWVVEACLQEKDLDSPFWGTPRVLRVLSQLTISDVEKLGKLLGGFLGGDDGGGTGIDVPPWVLTLMAKNPGPFEVWETTDALPFTNWGIMSMLSIDVARLYMCMFAGEDAFPGLNVGKKSVQEYLQNAYADMWRQVVKQVRDLPNVIGYDIMNEPNTNVIPLSAVAALAGFGVMDAAEATLKDLLGDEDGEFVFGLLSGLGLLPPLPLKPPDPGCDQIADNVQKKQCRDDFDSAVAQYEATRGQVLKDWGLDKMDAFAVLGMNVGFDRNYMKPFYERIGKAILAEDPKAVIFIESSMNISMLLGGIGGGMWDTSMDKLDLPEVVYAPHYYADIYPYLGINQPEREFQAEEVRYRDYQPGIEAAEALAEFALGNVPVVFGEFGTYFKFGGIANSIKQDYLVSSHILDNYYEAFERMFRSNMVWCYTPDNDRRYGDWWNKEDFSILGFDGRFRSQVAWSRPYARALAGRPLSTHFFGPLHYFDLNEKVVPPFGEFEVRYDSKETDAPTEIVVPRYQYPDGFYVWLSDGFAYYDDNTQILYPFPTEDDPGA